MPAWFLSNVLFPPNPPVAPDSLHNAAPYSPAVFETNMVFVRFIKVALQSIAPPFLRAVFCAKYTSDILLPLETPFRYIAPPYSAVFLIKLEWNITPADALQSIAPPWPLASLSAKRE